jgi:hypothetical protein
MPSTDQYNILAISLYFAVSTRFPLYSLILEVYHLRSECISDPVRFANEAIADI